MKLLSFADLKARGIVHNRVTLSRWQRFEGFPAGIVLGPNTRKYSEEEVEAWLRSRPAKRDAGKAA